ncbi:MAG: class I SAM-dependent RNA methyltransferase [Acidimicrobiales bacterium]
MMPVFELTPDRPATGGTAIGPGPDGRLGFVEGALPGERVSVEVTAEYPTRFEARTVAVLQPSAGRVAPACPEVARGCGGCDWQFARPEFQAELRRAVVTDCLRRLGGQSVGPDGAVTVEAGPTLDPWGYRTTLRAAVVDGRAGFRAHRSHRVVVPDRCLIAHPRAEELLVDGRFGDAQEVTIRVGTATGERMVVATPTAARVRVPAGVVVVGTDELAAGRTAHLHEDVAGQRLRISAGSFFQCRPDGAAALVATVGRALDAAGVDPGGVLVDAYGGVGLFGATLGRDRPVVGVESNRAAVADAGVNYGPDHRVVRSRVERWRADPAAVVIADPARSGLGKGGVAALVATGAAQLVLVSCDPASLARDARLLGGQGFRLVSVTTVDLFSQTSHIETVSSFVRA